MLVLVLVAALELEILVPLEAARVMRQEPSVHAEVAPLEDEEVQPPSWW